MCDNTFVLQRCLEGVNHTCRKLQTLEERLAFKRATWSAPSGSISLLIMDLSY